MDAIGDDLNRFECITNIKNAGMPYAFRRLFVYRKISMI